MALGEDLGCTRQQSLNTAQSSSLGNPDFHRELDTKAKARGERKVDEAHFPGEVVTNELESLFKVLPEVLLVAVGGRQPLVVE